MKSEIQLHGEAIKLREKMGHSNKEPLNIFSLLLSDSNCTLIKTNLSTNISGMCIRDGETKFIALNSKMSLGRQRFTAAHELYHLEVERLSDGRVCGATLYDAKSEKEREADIFASFFLMPYDGVEWYIESNQIKKWTVYEVIRLSIYFGISYLATIFRLERENRITKDYAAELRGYNVCKEAIKYGLDPKLYCATEEEFQVMGDYPRRLEECKEKGIIKQGLYNQYIREGNLETRKYPEMERGDLLND